MEIMKDEMNSKLKLKEILCLVDGKTEKMHQCQVVMKDLKNFILLPFM